MVAPVPAVLFQFTVSRWHETGDTATQKVSLSGKHFSMHSSAPHLTAATPPKKKEKKDLYNKVGGMKLQEQKCATDD